MDFPKLMASPLGPELPAAEILEDDNRIEI